MIEISILKKYCKCGCGKEIVQKRSWYVSEFLHGHNFKNKKRVPHTAWNKGLTKDKDIRAMKMHNSRIGQKRSFEAREKMSQARIDYLKKNGWGNAFYVKELGHNVMSSYEKTVGLFLKSIKEDYKYEKPFKIIWADGSTHNYLADFVIENKKVVYEAKGYIDEYSKIKCELFKKQYPEWKLILVGLKNMIINELPLTSYDEVIDIKRLEGAAC